MHSIIKNIVKHQKEIGYQASITLVMFTFFSYDQEGHEQAGLISLFAFDKLAFFGNYFLAATFINYVLLPTLYYKRSESLFFLSVIPLIIVVILMDELVLEQIFYPDTRGSYFPGIPFTLLETLPIIIILVAFKLAWDFNSKQREIERLNNLAKESELQYLKYQINPHFLFNNLNNLYSFAIDNSPKTPSFILELSSVLRYMLYDCKEDYVSLKKEMDHLKNYIALNEIQIENRGEITFTEDISSIDYTLSPLILVVFIEIAFKHSTKSLLKDIAINIQFTTNSHGLMTLSCSNNYLPNFDCEGPSGIGLENVKKRLELMYPNRFELNISDIDNTYLIELSIQLNPTSQC